MSDRTQLLATINTSPLLVSLLYDLNLMPEQVDCPLDERQMRSVVAHFARVRNDAIEECAKECDVIASECEDRSEDYLPPNANSFVKACARTIRALKTVEGV